MVIGPGVALDERLGGDVVVVRDDDGGLFAAEAGDDEVANGAGVGGQSDGSGLRDLGPVMRAGPVQGDVLVVGAGQGVDVPDQGGYSQHLVFTAPIWIALR
jgi:hypothetical protein